MLPHFAVFPGIDAVAEHPCGERQRGLSVPCDLRAGRSVVAAVQVTAHRHHEAERLPEIPGRRQLPGAGEVRQQRQLDGGERGRRRQFRLRPRQVREGRDPPGDHRVDRHGPLDARAGPVRDRFRLASRLQDSVPVLDTPPQPVEPDRFAGLVQAGDRQRREQKIENQTSLIVDTPTAKPVAMSD